MPRRHAAGLLWLLVVASTVATRAPKHMPKFVFSRSESPITSAKSETPLGCSSKTPCPSSANHLTSCLAQSERLPPSDNLACPKLGREDPSASFQPRESEFITPAEAAHLTPSPVHPPRISPVPLSVNVVLVGFGDHARPSSFRLDAQAFQEYLGEVRALSVPLSPLSSPTTTTSSLPHHPPSSTTLSPPLPLSPLFRLFRARTSLTTATHKRPHSRDCTSLTWLHR